MLFIAAYVAVGLLFSVWATKRAINGMEQGREGSEGMRRVCNSTGWDFEVAVRVATTLGWPFFACHGVVGVWERLVFWVRKARAGRVIRAYNGQIFRKRRFRFRKTSSNGA